MNAIKNCVAEFTKIHMQHIKFQQKLELMRINHEYKMQELKQRNSCSDLTPSTSEPTQLIEWQTEGATEYLKLLQEKRLKK